MRLNELREWLAKRLGRKDVPDSLWQHLLERYRDEVEAARFDGHEDRDALLAVARELLRLMETYEAGTVTRSGNRSRPRERTSYVKYPELDEVGKERSAAMAEGFAAAAEGMPEVQQFRHAFLSGKLLADDDMEALLLSPAAALFSRRMFEEWDLPLVGHRAELVVGEIQQPAQLIVYLDPGGAIWAREATESRSTRRQIHVRIPDSEGSYMRNIHVWPDSALEELWKAAERLKVLFDWPPAFAGIPFLLQGKIPSYNPIKVGQTGRHHGPYYYERVQLEIDPWVPAEVVLQAYRWAQDMILDRANRPLRRRNIAVFRFVTRRRADENPSPSWRQLVKEWNSAHSDDGWRYQDHRCFARDYQATKQQLMTSMSPSTLIAVRDILFPGVTVRGQSGKMYEPGWPN